MPVLKQISIVNYDVTDWNKAKEFYGHTLELPLFNSADDFGWCEFGGKDQVHLAISHWRGPDPLPPTNGGGIAIFNVEDAVAAVAELRRRGVKCDDPVAVPGMVTYAQFYDPDGNRLQLAGPPPKP